MDAEQGVKGGLTGHIRAEGQMHSRIEERAVGICSGGSLLPEKTIHHPLPEWRGPKAVIMSY